MKVITIGRSTENNDIVVNDEKVSRNHLQMVMDDNGNYSVVDLGSTNGTFVNGQRISGEVRLQPNDEVRIGQTVLPWQSYFAGVQASNQQLQPLTNSSSHNNAYTPKPRPLWVYVVVGAIALLLIGGGIGWKLYNDKQERIAQEQKDKDSEAAQEKAKEEAEKARDAASKANEEYQNAMRRAAESQSEEDKRAAEVAARKAEEANKLAQQKEEEWKSMKVELEKARSAQHEAEVQNDLAQQAKAEAEQESQQAKEAARKAKEAQGKAEKEAKLTEEFFSIIYKATDSQLKNICSAIGKKDKDIPRRMLERRNLIIEEFKNAKTNKDRQDLLNKANEVIVRSNKNGSSSPNNEDIGESKENVVSETIDTLQVFETPANDTVKQ